MKEERHRFPAVSRECILCVCLQVSSKIQGSAIDCSGCEPCHCDTFEWYIFFPFFSRSRFIFDSILLLQYQMLLIQVRHEGSIASDRWYASYLHSGRVKTTSRLKTVQSTNSIRIIVLHLVIGYRSERERDTSSPTETTSKTSDS